MHQGGIECADPLCRVWCIMLSFDQLYLPSTDNLGSDLHILPLQKIVRLSNQFEFHSDMIAKFTIPILEITPSGKTVSAFMKVKTL